ncbi:MULTISPECIES: phosphoenolpyruvate--protein phosphotransferase [Pseudomonadaceae]|jgi:phosphotransferase system enzyme I (PtsP)|uniref:phosphoenolpyruvate--protein phosphotransferase n=1 Tax=Ectopseudomonas alcaliphila TaxID=101564 RepID=A0A1G7I2N5_9GAMM|nr:MULTISPECIES: phosphoenolpyruvate--protein phosphotransferase [Pseudomonas]PKM27983.1 MAG: phosphoenolpyruvate-protein phosphotransferase PtsP [Gammaproteobacteria bacterium HGW-Gammaproteobacteria-12]MDG9759611.1 phosphoenolpyruvate--protein phosphotransferase [Pseudomonas sediminis]MDP9942446.1 phosphotransferase system enzyme I (PtsP) [Pseudomonas sp. 3400]MDR7014176.1 phosphotransferase system enzyme I (PtsP) [Pseudomonas alcaliphila]MDX5993589.1 phosphoenolpyruvate--protein phosphotran
MLNTLRKIVQEVNAAKDLKAALSIIVQRVKEAMGSQVCSVYLLDAETNRFVLMATDGLNKRSIGKVSMAPSEGLVGLVGSREEPLNLEDAASHPRYRYFAETGEERYASFLGAPIIHHRRVMGVLVVQQKERRQFDEGEEAFLVTMSAQLAGVIAHAEATGSIRGLGRQGKGVQEAKFVGVPGAPGAAVGTAVVVLPPADLNVVPDRSVDDIAAELELFDKALGWVREDMQELSEKLATQLRKEERALFDVYLMMLEDAALGNEVRKVIRTGQWAQGALRQVVLDHVNRFELMDDAYLRERASDVRDLGRRLLAYLQEERKTTLVYPDNSILVSEELSPAMLGEVPEGKLVGLISVTGSGNSHVAIFARAMGIPTVMGVVDLPYSKIDGIKLIVDGYHGEVFTNPSDLLSKQYAEVVEEERQLTEGLDALRALPCETLDGHRMPLWVNTGLLADVARAQQRGAEGVGLYRTEVPFMINERFPSEKEQLATYREQLQAFHPLPVTMRTLDIGGDKSLSYFPIKEENPFLGWRGIRVTLDHPEIFLVQTRAMLKASEGLNNLRILLPMISGTQELEEALHLIHRAWGEVRDEGTDVPLPPIGVMIEIPAAVYQTRELARQVDFLSVGSNDLTQYLLAVDRNNPRVADLYDFLHPAVLQALQKVVNDAHLEGKPVSICGEMAGDPAAAVLLLAMGFDSLSMNATNLPKVKWLLRQVTQSKAKELLGQVMTMDNPHLIYSTLHLALRNLGLGRVINPASNIQA